MNDDRDETAEAVDATADVKSAKGERRALTSDDFLVPGPSPESNEGLARWGLTWLAFSLLLMLLVLCVSFACLMLANWTGVA